MGKNKRKSERQQPCSAGHLRGHLGYSGHGLSSFLKGRDAQTPSKARRQGLNVIHCRPWEVLSAQKGGRTPRPHPAEGTLRARGPRTLLVPITLYRGTPRIPTHPLQLRLCTGLYLCPWAPPAPSCSVYSHLGLTSFVLGQKWFGNWAYKWQGLNALLLSSLPATQ